MTARRFVDQPTDLVGGWTVRWTDTLPDDVTGATRWRDRTIWLDSAMAPVEVPHVMLHELMHALRGPGGDNDEAEQEVDEAADRVLGLMGLAAFVLDQDHAA